MTRTLVMIHGMWGTHASWDHYRQFMEARGYHCVIPDLRHHGVSPQDPPPPGLGDTGLEDYADDLEDLIRSMPEPPVIIGHSMGGLLAQLLAEASLLVESHFIQAALQAAGGRLDGAAHTLRISSQTLVERMERLGLPLPAPTGSEGLPALAS